jgi:uncharacterized 2Fe-2S/4Fe-4S cluster protein (DUF4445 family)
LLNIIHNGLEKNYINSLCNGTGKCGKCRVRILTPNLNIPRTSVEKQLLGAEISENIYLACQIFPEENINLKIEILDLREYHDNIFKIQDTFTNFQLNFPFNPNIINEELPALGVVTDIGTTSIVLTVIDLSNGRILGADSILNPQIEFGRDIMTRLTYALKSPSNQKQLQMKVFGGISKLLKNVMLSIGVSTKDIVEMIVVGNTVMHHLFLNLSINKLARAPFIPTVSGDYTTTVKAIDIKGVLNLPSQSIITMPPLIGGFIGSDAVVDILYTGFDKYEGIHLLIDFGTNSEIVLTVDGKLFAASVAAGGAFEGQHINCGMRGIKGAIEKFWIDDGKYRYNSIQSIKPKGICGTGIIDILAELLVNNQLDKRGRLFNQSRVQTKKLILIPAEKTELNHPIYITRTDVESIQKAKAATMAAIRTLTNYLDIEIDKINTIHIAGVFGSKLNLRNAKKIGLLPKLPDNRFRIHGNAAEKGGRTILLSKEARKEAKTISEKVTRRELTTFPEFQSYFTEELFFPEDLT